MNKFWKSQYNSLDENLHNKSELHSSHERIGVHCYKVYKSWKLINSRVHYLSVRNWTECISHFTPLHFKDYRKFGTEDVSSINSDRWIKHHHEQYNRAISPETKGINWISHVSLFQQRRWTSKCHSWARTHQVGREFRIRKLHILLRYNVACQIFIEFVSHHGSPTLAYPPSHPVARCLILCSLSLLQTQFE